MNNEKNTSPIKKASLLQRIMAFTGSDENYQPESITVPKKEHISSEKQKMAPIRNIKAALLVLGVFYILLCAFILLNPQFAGFFNNVFGIEYITIQFVLKYTIFVFYTIFGIVLGVAFLFFWYRSLIIKTHKKYKQIVLWMLTLLFGGLFFGNMALFAVTYNWFLSIDFSNIEERVIPYDNTLLGYKRTLPGKNMAFFRIPKKVIGPISIRYDISPQIKKIVRENSLLLNRGYSFMIDYNKDGDPDTGSGNNMKVELPITDPDAPVLVPGEYNEVGQYKTTAILKAVDAAGNNKEITIDFPDVLVQNIVKVTQKEGKDGAKIYIFDASDLSNIGQARWSIIDEPGTEYSDYQFSPTRIARYPAVVCLKMQPMDIGTTDPCDWRYVIADNIQTNITNTDIQIKVDPINPLKYQFSIDPKLGLGQIKTIKWKVDGRLYDGKFVSGTETIFDYTFKSSGTYSIEAEIVDTMGNMVTTSTEPIFTTLFTDLKNDYTLRILDENEVDISKNRYNEAAKTYFLPDISAPTMLTFDAMGIQSTDPRLRLAKAEWDMDNDGTYEKEGFKLSYELALPEQYTFNARYTFEDKTVNGDIKPQIQVNKIVVKGIRIPIDVRVRIRPDHDYAPALVHFDATGSRVQQGEILKFLYDFGDGSKIYEGEGIVDYRYKTPGEYKIYVTAVTKDGKKATKESMLIIKKPQETIKILPSVASQNAQAGYPITFSVSTQGVIQKVIWDFGDNTGLIEGESVIHTFQTSGIYNIVARAMYESGIEKSETITYGVQ